MPRSTDVFNVSFPAELAAQVRRTAKAENRTLSELFRECYRAYREKRFRETFDASHEAFQEWADANNLSEDQMKQEIEAAIAEVSDKRRRTAVAERGRKSNKAAPAAKTRALKVFTAS